jgi:ParB family chromosome partitioning protein
MTDGPSSDHAKRTNLGRGLAALFGEEEEDYASLDKVRSTKTVPIEHLRPGRFQPRHHFDEAAVNALAESIKAQGILQPILVRRLADRPNEFEIVAGERRWRAAQIAKLHEVPVLIRDLSDAESLELAIVENVQRQDLTPLEEAEGYKRLIDEFEHTQEDLARTLGKSRSHIANTLRLLGLPEGVKLLLDEGKLTAGHARTLIGCDTAEELAQKIISRGLNVRQAEKLVQHAKAAPAGAKAAKLADADKGKDTDTLALERDLTALLGLKVSINFQGNGGSLTIHYRTLEQLDDVLHRLNQMPPPNS